MKNEYYLWTTKSQADAALASINSHPAFPIQGKNVATGEPMDNWTTCWCDNVVQTTDGMWGFPRIPANFMDNMGIQEEQRNAWISTFAPEIVDNPDIIQIEESL